MITEVNTEGRGEEADGLVCTVYCACVFVVK
jgi:hypothetical protein